MLLDTHVWIWLLTEDTAKLGSKTRRSIEKAARSGDVWVSTMSAFEIATLHTTGRIQFSQPVERWIRESIDRAEFRVIDLERDIAVDAGLIPSSALGDPIDRCLVATAREYDLTLITRDRVILDYATRTAMVRVADAAA